MRFDLCFLSTFLLPICSSEKQKPSPPRKNSQRYKNPPTPIQNVSRATLPIPPIPAILHMVSKSTPDPADPTISRSCELRSVCTFLTPSLVLATFHSINFADSIQVVCGSFKSYGRVVHVCPTADLALVELTNKFSDLSGSPTISATPSSKPYSLVEPYHGQNFHFELYLGRRKAYLPAYQTLPFLITEETTFMERGWSGSPVLTLKKEIGGILRGSDPSGKAYVVPGAFIKSFLASYPIKQATFGLLAIKYQILNKRLAECLRVPQSLSGVRVSRSMASEILEGDVVTAIDGQRVLPGGSICVEKVKESSVSHLHESLKPVAISDTSKSGDRYLIAPLEYFCALRPRGTRMTVEIIRNGSLISVDTTLSEISNGLDRPIDGEYVNIRGYIFTTLRVAYLREWGRQWQVNAPPRLMAMTNGILGNKEDPIVISGLHLDREVDAEEQTFFAQACTDAVVVSINKHPVKGLETLKGYSHLEGEDIVIEFDSGDLLVI